MSAFNIPKALFGVSKSTLKSYKKIPGPKSLPVFGSLFTLKQFGGKYNIMEFREFQNVLQAEFGNIVRWEFLNEKNVYLYDPEYIREAYKHENNMPQRSQIPPITVLNKKLGIKSTLLNSQGERWRQLRSLSNPSMARPQTIHSYVRNHNQVANELINLIHDRFDKQSHDEKQVISIPNFDQLLRLMALEFISEIAFDKKLNCVNESKRLPDVTELVKNIETFFIQIGRLLWSPPLWRIYATEDWIKFEKAGRYVYRVAGDYIRQAQLNAENSEKRTVLKEFLARKEKYGLTIQDVVSIMTDFLIGGVDTTSTAIYYLLYELGVNPDVQEKLNQEIISIVGDDPEVTEQHIEKFKYLKCIVKESMRLHSTVPANGRILSQDMVIDGYLIPKGTCLVFCNSYITKTDKYFKNAKKFDPERWIRDENEIHPYSTLSFSFGPRMCVGRRVAEQEIYLTLVKLIRNFKIEYKGEEPGLKIGLIAAPDRPLNLNFEKRIKL